LKVRLNFRKLFAIQRLMGLMPQRKFVLLREFLMQNFLKLVVIQKLMGLMPRLKLVFVMQNHQVFQVF